MSNEGLVRKRQAPLVRRYADDPAAAQVTDVARTEWSGDDPLHSRVVVGPRESARVPIGVHTAVGGLGDEATPGDVLCAALASCMDSTLRLVANRLRLPIESLRVEVRGEVDVRGTLLVSDEVPVGFQRLAVDVALALPADVPDARRALLLRTAERCCIVMQTLRGGVRIETNLAGSADA